MKSHPQPIHSEGERVWYMDRQTFVNAQIIKIIPGYYEFENGVRIEQGRCFSTFEQLAKSLKKQKTR